MTGSDSLVVDKIVRMLGTNRNAKKHLKRLSEEDKAL